MRSLARTLDAIDTLDAAAMALGESKFQQLSYEERAEVRRRRDEALNALRCMVLGDESLRIHAEG